MARAAAESGTPLGGALLEALETRNAVKFKEFLDAHPEIAQAGAVTRDGLTALQAAMRARNFNAVAALVACGCDFRVSARADLESPEETAQRLVPVAAAILRGWASARSEPPPRLSEDTQRLAHESADLDVREPLPPLPAPRRRADYPVSPPVAPAPEHAAAAAAAAHAPRDVALFPGRRCDAVCDRRILSFLDHRSLFAARCVSRAWRAVCEEDTVCEAAFKHLILVAWRDSEKQEGWHLTCYTPEPDMQVEAVRANMRIVLAALRKERPIPPRAFDSAPHAGEEPLPVWASHTLPMELLMCLEHNTVYASPFTAYHIAAGHLEGVDARDDFHVAAPVPSTEDMAFYTYPFPEAAARRSLGKNIRGQFAFEMGYQVSPEQEREEAAAAAAAEPVLEGLPFFRLLRENLHARWVGNRLHDVVHQDDLLVSENMYPLSLPEMANEDAEEKEEAEEEEAAAEEEEADEEKEEESKVEMTKEEDEKIEQQQEEEDEEEEDERIEKESVDSEEEDAMQPVGPPAVLNSHPMLKAAHPFLREALQLVMREHVRNELSTALNTQFRDQDMNEVVQIAQQAFIALKARGELHGKSKEETEIAKILAPAAAARFEQQVKEAEALRAQSLQAIDASLGELEQRLAALVAVTRAAWKEEQEALAERRRRALRNETKEKEAKDDEEEDESEPDQDEEDARALEELVSRRSHLSLVRRIGESDEAYLDRAFADTVDAMRKHDVLRRRVLPQLLVVLHAFLLGHEPTDGDRLFASTAADILTNVLEAAQGFVGGEELSATGRLCVVAESLSTLNLHAFYEQLGQAFPSEAADFTALGSRRFLADLPYFDYGRGTRWLDHFACGPSHDDRVSSGNAEDCDCEDEDRLPLNYALAFGVHRLMRRAGIKVAEPDSTVMAVALLREFVASVIRVALKVRRMRALHRAWRKVDYQRVRKQDDAKKLKADRMRALAKARAAAGVHRAPGEEREAAVSVADEFKAMSLLDSRNKARDEAAAPAAKVEEVGEEEEEAAAAEDDEEEEDEEEDEEEEEENVITLADILIAIDVGERYYDSVYSRLGDDLDDEEEEEEEEEEDEEDAEEEEEEEEEEKEAEAAQPARKDSAPDAPSPPSKGPAATAPQAPAEVRVYQRDEKIAPVVARSDELRNLSGAELKVVARMDEEARVARSSMWVADRITSQEERDAEEYLALVYDVFGVSDAAYPRTAVHRKRGACRKHMVLYPMDLPPPLSAEVAGDLKASARGVNRREEDLASDPETDAAARNAEYVSDGDSDSDAEPMFAQHPIDPEEPRTRDAAIAQEREENVRVQQYLLSQSSMASAVLHARLREAFYVILQRFALRAFRAPQTDAERAAVEAEVEAFVANMPYVNSLVSRSFKGASDGRLERSRREFARARQNETASPFLGKMRQRCELRDLRVLREREVRDEVMDSETELSDVDEEKEINGDDDPFRQGISGWLTATEPYLGVLRRLAVEDAEHSAQAMRFAFAPRGSEDPSMPIIAAAQLADERELLRIELRRASERVLDEYFAEQAAHCALLRGRAMTQEPEPEDEEATPAGAKAAATAPHGAPDEQEEEEEEEDEDDG